MAWVNINCVGTVRIQLVTKIKIEKVELIMTKNKVEIKGNLLRLTGEEKDNRLKYLQGKIDGMLEDKVRDVIEKLQNEEYYYYKTLTEAEIDILTKIYVTGMNKGVVRLELNDSDFGFEHNQEEYFEDYTKFPIVIALYKELNNLSKIKQVIDL